MQHDQNNQWPSSGTAPGTRQFLANEDAGSKLIGLKADRKAQARVAELARKCNEGGLTAEERNEYETYVMAGEFIAILQAKARILLTRRQPA